MKKVENIWLEKNLEIFSEKISKSLEETKKEDCPLEIWSDGEYDPPGCSINNLERCVNFFPYRKGVAVKRKRENCCALKKANALFNILFGST